MNPLLSPTAQLYELARNLWWTWQPDVVAIFRDLDPTLWREVNHNPVAFLKRLPPDQLSLRAAETGLESRVAFAFRRLEHYLHDAKTWGRRVCGMLRASPVAYFSAEFALHESLPIYSGGLGALAGDHLKAASDLDVPIVGVGIFYAQGYFRQRIGASGWQEEAYGTVDTENLPLHRATGLDETPLTVEVPVGSERIRVGAWRAQVGRSQLVLLDSDIEGNTAEHRQLTAHLYGGDAKVRLRQELILGVGGMRMLEALGIEVGVLHMNEGHSAFAPLELSRRWAATDAVPFRSALREVALHTVFTTHTPVPAGHDWFPPDLVLDHLGWLAKELGIAPDELLGLGRVDRTKSDAPFCMTVLALRSARYTNGVSALHGHVTRQAWQSLWPGRAEADVPIAHITNGVHIPSWLAVEVSRLYDTYLPSEWRARLLDALENLEAIDEAAFWEAHQLLKRRMLNFVARRCEAQGTSLPEDCPLDLERLTVTFARRFAEYKRAGLLFTDLDRLAQLVNGSNGGLQIIVAGKAHPHDDSGKKVLQRIVTLTQDERFRGRLVFVEDYDFNVARHLVQGGDVWLNTPRRPLEACGTSGQKVLLNGGLHLSVLDGWWAEAFDGENGFAIGDRHVHINPDVQDRRDAASLYRVLEQEVVPLYYDRNSANVPRRWVERVMHSMKTLIPQFNASRMVRDYVLRCYFPAAGGHSTAGGSGSFSPV